MYVTTMVIILYAGCRLISSPAAEENGDVIVCPGSLLTLTCIHNNARAEQTRWEMVIGNITIASVALHDTSTGSSFGPFTFLEISDTSGPTLTSTVEATVTESLDGTVVLCRAGGLSDDAEVDRVTVRTLQTIPSMFH